MTQWPSTRMIISPWACLKAMFMPVGTILPGLSNILIFRVFAGNRGWSHGCCQWTCHPRLGSRFDHVNNPGEYSTQSRTDVIAFVTNREDDGNKWGVQVLFHFDMTAWNFPELVGDLLNLLDLYFNSSPNLRCMRFCISSTSNSEKPSWVQFWPWIG